MSVQRPAHPYAMYSQSGLDDETSSVRDMHAIPPTVPAIQTAMPVGFPGLNNGYHRVLGPDGEEQDIIGPDGHTEQLPLPPPPPNLYYLQSRQLAFHLRDQRRRQAIWHTPPQLTLYLRSHQIRPRRPC